MQDTRKRRYLITINNPTMTPTELVNEHIAEYQVKYMLCTHEVGEQGTPHLHAYVEYVNGATFQQVLERFQTIEQLPDGDIKKYQYGHIDTSIADGNANKRYLMKSQPSPMGIDLCEYGEMSVKMSIDDIASDVIELISEHMMKPLEISKQYPLYANYIVKNWKTLMDIYMQVWATDKQIPY